MQVHTNCIYRDNNFRKIQQRSRNLQAMKKRMPHMTHYEGSLHCNIVRCTRAVESKALSRHTPPHTQVNVYDVNLRVLLT